MELSPTSTDRHVDEAIRLFNFSTMNAIQSGLGNLKTKLQLKGLLEANFLRKSKM